MGTRKIVTAAVAALVLLSWGLVAAPSAGQNPTPLPAGAGPATVPLRNCKIFWEDERIISSKIQGRIAERPVKDGQLVEEGDVLAKLDDREAELEFKRQDILGKSDLDELKEYTKLEEYNARLDSAGRLVRAQAISVEEWRMAGVNVRFSELSAKKEAEKRQLEKIKAEQTEVILKEHVIRSPIRGMIKKCFKREMELVTPSDHQMFHIIATDKVWVEGFAPVSDVYRVKDGQTVKVSLAIHDADRSQPSTPEERKNPISPGLPSTTTRPLTATEPRPEPQFELPFENNFEGTIVYIDPDVDFTARAFRVRAEVKNKFDPDTKLPILRAGMNANMTIIVKPSAANGSEPKN